MEQFHLEYSGTNIQCPNCRTKYNVVWNNKDGQSIDGTYTIFCRECQQPIKFSCYATTIYETK